MQQLHYEGISILMPAFNEGRHIYRNIQETEKAAKQFATDYEIVVVDDGSRDNTLFEMKRAARESQNLKILSYPENMGKGWALKQAYQICSAPYVLFLDSDLDIHPRQFGTLLQAQSECNADVVIGSKRHPKSSLNYPLLRKIISSSYFFLVRMLFGLPLRDTQTGIKLFKREVLEEVLPRISIKKYAFDLEILVNAYQQGFKIVEAPVVVNFKGRFGRIGIGSIWNILNDTMIIYYRKRITGYDDRSKIIGLENPDVKQNTECTHGGTEP